MCLKQNYRYRRNKYISFLVSINPKLTTRESQNEPQILRSSKLQFWTNYINCLHSADAYEIAAEPYL